MSEKVLTRSEFLGLTKRRIKTVTVLDSTLRIQSLPDSEMISMRESFVDRKGALIRSKAKRLQQLLVARCLIDDAGTRLFSDEDVFSGSLDSIDGGVISGVYAACKEHTGFAADEDWGAIEDEAKNSEGTNSNGSTKG